MSDLVDALNKAAGFRSDGDAGLMGQAAEQIAALVAERDALRKALEFYADCNNWRRNSSLDANSARFTGGPAHEVLKAIDARAALSPEHQREEAK